MCQLATASKPFAVRLELDAGGGDRALVAFAELARATL
jgi:hypothetical protein